MYIQFHMYNFHNILVTRYYIKSGINDPRTTFMFLTCVLFSILLLPLFCFHSFASILSLIYF